LLSAVAEFESAGLSPSSFGDYVKRHTCGLAYGLDLLTWKNKQPLEIHVRGSPQCPWAVQYQQHEKREQEQQQYELQQKCERERQARQSERQKQKFLGQQEETKRLKEAFTCRRCQAKFYFNII